MTKQEAENYPGYVHLMELSPQERFKALQDDKTRSQIATKLNALIQFRAISEISQPIELSKKQTKMALYSTEDQVVFDAIFTFNDDPRLEMKKQKQLKAPEEEPVELKLDWVQQLNSPTPYWTVPFPEPERNAPPILSIAWDASKPYEQNEWLVTVLNLYIVSIKEHIWYDMNKLKATAEEIYAATLIALQEPLK